MKQISAVKSLPPAISGPLVKAYNAGVYGLIFILGGTILLLFTSFFAEGILRYILGSIGAFTILAFIVLLYFKLAGIIKHIGKIGELFNTVQETAIYMTDFAYTLQAVAYKNAEEVSTTITQVRSTIEDVTSMPLLSSIPGVEQIGNIADNPHVVRAEDLSKSVVATTVTAKTVIEEVKTALTQSDTAQLQKYLGQLKNIELQVKGLLGN
ncbi:MAG: hypothetical protein ACFB2X_07395 [Rivularia sp. (in: cyanobacteria)]